MKETVIACTFAEHLSHGRVPNSVGKIRKWKTARQVARATIKGDVGAVGDRGQYRVGTGKSEIYRAAYKGGNSART